MRKTCSTKFLLARFLLAFQLRVQHFLNIFRKSLQIVRSVFVYSLVIKDAGSLLEVRLENFSQHPENSLPSNENKDTFEVNIPKTISGKTRENIVCVATAQILSSYPNSKRESAVSEKKETFRC